MIKVSTELDPIQVGGVNYRLKFKGPDVSEEARQKLTQVAARQLQAAFAQNPDLSPFDIARITKRAIFTKDDGKTPKNPAEWEEVRSILEEGTVKIAIPDAEKVNDPEDPIFKEDRARVTFRNIDKPHYLDGIDYPRTPRLPGESDADFHRRVTKRLAGPDYDPAKAKTRDTLIGIAMSDVERQNYEMTIELQEDMQNFFGGPRSFTSSEIVARNGLIPKSVASSFNRYVDAYNEVTLMRSIEAEDGSVDCLAGRVYNLKTAEDMVRFSFLSEMNLFRNPDSAAKAQGITEGPNGEYEFEFAVQSLLPMMHGGERRMFDKEVEGYRQLLEEYRDKPLLITDPENGTVYPVRIRPVPIAASQFNYMNTAEKILPEALSGELDAQEQTRAADEMLFQRAEAKLPSYNIVRQTQIKDTIFFLRSGTLNPWQELLARGYLCHLLDIPIIIHCKSCVDRTNVNAALVTAMKQWIRTGKEIPRKDGRYAVFMLNTVKFDQKTLEGSEEPSKTFYPFRELFAYNLHKGVKITEFSRGAKGYKFNRGPAQHPALQDLLPLRYLAKPANWKKRWIVTNLKAAGLIVGGVLAYFVPPIVFQILGTLGAIIALGLKGTYQKLRSWVKGIPNKDKSFSKLGKTLEKIWPQYKIAKNGKVLKAIGATIGAFIPAIVYATGYSIYKYCKVRPKWWVAKAIVYGLGTPITAPLKLLANARNPFAIRQIKEKYTKAVTHSLLYGMKNVDLFDLESSDS